MLNELKQKVEPLISFFVKSAQKRFGDRIVSIFKFGSLGDHGDFSLCSDVDLVLMFNNAKPTDSNEIKNLIDEVKLSGLEYSDRISVFWSVYDNELFSHGAGRFPPLDRFDLIYHGVLIFGVDRRNELSPPTHSDIVVASAEFISSYMLTEEKLDELKNNPQNIIAKGARYLSKFILFPARLIFTLDYPNKVGSNKESVLHFNNVLKKRIPDNFDIVNAAYALRSMPADSKVKMDTEELRTILMPLYRYCIDRYSDAILQLGFTEFQNQLFLIKQELD